MLMESVDEMKQHFEEMENKTTFLNSEFCDPTWSFASQISNSSSFMSPGILPSLDVEDLVNGNLVTNVWSFEDSYATSSIENIASAMPHFDHYCTNTFQNAAEADELGKLVEVVQKPTSVCTFDESSNMNNQFMFNYVSTGSSITNAFDSLHKEKCSETPFVNDFGCIKPENWDNNLRSATSGQNSDYGTSSSGCTSLFSNLGLDKLLYGTSKRRRFETSLPSSDSCSINVRNGDLRAKGSENPSKTIKKKAKPGTRPIPKDRLLTCARLAELRELIPNGEKMSIDRLLQRTIKHLHFLQSVTKHAKTLAKSEDRNVANGVTWACEIENERMICPLIVEDLSTPGQMLIEILCQEQGLFLEIVDIIRSFGLNILNGFMKFHEAKICARYIVEAAEANRFVSRHEIFSELVRVLQLTDPGENRTNDHW